MELEKLLLEPESKTLGFKRDLSSLDSIVKTVVAFANTAGGILIIGVSPSGDLVGIDDVFKAEEKLANAIADTIHPPLLPEIEIATVKGKHLLVVKVAYWRGLFYLKKLGMPQGVYARLGSTSRPAGQALVEEMQRTLLHPFFDEQPVSDLTLESLDLVKAREVFLEKEKELDEKKMRSLGLLKPCAKGLVPSIGGVILFGKEEVRRQFFPDARISCARFHGDDKRELIDRYEVDGTILDAVETVPKFIARNTRLAASIKSMRRKDIPEYPIVAVREVLINALAHADYSINGAHIHIAIFNNRLEIQNPGTLPFGFTLDDLRAGVSRVRNRVIARVFSELDLMEEWGSGYKRVMGIAASLGYPEPVWQELSSSFRVTFYPHPATLLQKPQKVKKLPVQRKSGTKHHPLTLASRRLISRLYGRK